MVAKSRSGFSLIELMIVVAIIGVLAAIALPAYESQVTESRRGDAQKELLRLQLQQESYRLDNSSYGTAANVTVPTSSYHVFTITNVTATTYTLTATAKGSQTSDTGCTAITVDQSSTKLPTACW